MINAIKSNPNHLGTVVSALASKAGKPLQQFAFDLQARHITSIHMHFDDKGTVKVGRQAGIVGLALISVCLGVFSSPYPLT